MNRRLLRACLAVAVLHGPDPSYAQFTDPRAYENTPTATNQFELGYGCVRGNASIDTSLIVTGAQFNLHQATIGYTRFFGWFHRLMWVEAAVPVARLSGSIAGTNIQGSANGAGDSSYGLAMLLIGGTALSVAEFDHYEPSTTVGVSLSVTAPTGSYRSNRILNLGAERWSFKPEIALSHPFGPQDKWQFDGYANVYFFTDNTSYRGREILRQEALPGFEGHISYSFNGNVWASFDARYSLRGPTLVNGVSQDNAQQNFILGTQVNIALNPRNSLIVEFGKALVHRNGPALSGLGVTYSYAWAKAER